jgi:hypothetical protein
MTLRRKILLPLGIVVAAPLLLICIGLFCLGPSLRESRFRTLCATLVIGIPNYEKFHSSTMENNAFLVELTQTDSQLRQFSDRLSLPPTALFNSTGDWAMVELRLDSQHPWMFFVRAETNSSAEKTYKVHIEGRHDFYADTVNARAP